jgi:hypothetical protein
MWCSLPHKSPILPVFGQGHKAKRFLRPLYFVAPLDSTINPNRAGLRFLTAARLSAPNTATGAFRYTFALTTVSELSRSIDALGDACRSVLWASGSGDMARSLVRPARLQEGDKMEGNYRGKGRWCPGRISRVNADGAVQRGL